MLRQAEGEYSRLRLRSLADEWYSDYPTLLSFVDLLKGRPACFSLDNISDDDCLNLCVKLHEQKIEPKDDLSRAALNLVDTVLTCDDFRRAVMVAFYKISLVGLKLEHYESVSWSIGGRRSVSAAEIQPGTRVAIHSCFWRTLGVREDVLSTPTPTASRRSGLGQFRLPLRYTTEDDPVLAFFAGGAFHLNAWELAFFFLLPFRVWAGGLAHPSLVSSPITQ